MLTLFRIAPDATAAKPEGGGFVLPASVQSSCRLATGRSALRHLIDRLPSGPAPTVLLPCYVAEGVIQPFSGAGFAVRFYRLNADLTPVVEDVESLLRDSPANAVFVLIHFFGFSARSAALSSVLSKHGAIVVDDFAHAPFTTTPSGRALVDESQLGLYSLNKFLPVVDGAILVSKRADIDVSIDEGKLPELLADIQLAYQDHLRAGRGLFEAGDAQQAEACLRELEKTYEQYYAGISRDLSPHRQSARSLQIEKTFPCDRLVERRLSNSRILYEGLHSAAVSPVHPGLPAGVVPLCIPARVAAESRGRILADLFGQGTLISTLQDKWDFVPRRRREQFQVETAFLEENVLIPVSEFISTDSMQNMVAQLNNV